MINLETIRQAAAQIDGKVRRTELIESHYYSQRVGAPLSEFRGQFT